MTSDSFGAEPGERDSAGQPGFEGPQTGQPGAFDQPGPFSQPGPGPQFGQEQPYGQGPYGQGPYGPQYGSPGPFPGGFNAPPGVAWTGGRTNSLAIAALCCGIGQVIAGPLSGIPAIVLGAMSLNQIKQTGEQGRGMAITGLVLGIVGVILTTLFVLLVVVAFQQVQVQNVP